MAADLCKSCAEAVHRLHAAQAYIQGKAICCGNRSIIERAAKDMIQSPFYTICDAPAEVKHGRWEQISTSIYSCSECETIFGNAYRYCPNCGAKMDEKESEQ
jgi:hypothetical protein